MSTAPETGSGGRPDERFPQRAITQQPEVAEQAELAEGVERPGKTLVSIVATVNLTRNEGKIQFVNPVPNGRATVLEHGSAVVLRTRQADGLSLRDYPVPVKLSSELSPGDERRGMVDPVIEVDPEARVIELSIAEEVADRVEVGGSLPAVAAVRRVADDGKELMFALAPEAGRALEGNHTYSVQVSTDDGNSWQTMSVGLKEPRYTLDRSQFRAGEEVQVRVVTTNGIQSSVVSRDRFLV